MSFPSFSTGEVLTAADMNAVGLWLVKTQTVGTGVSSVTVTGAFSADYDNYLVTLSGGTMSASTGITLQIGNAATAYYGTYVYGLYTGTLLNASDNNNTKFSYVGSGNADGAYVNVTIMGPQLARRTRVFANGVSWDLNMGSYTGRLDNTTQYTSFVLAPISGTFTGGTIRVYGYRN